MRVPVQTETGRCLPVGTYALPTRCRGSVRLYAKLDRKRRVGRKRFSVTRGFTRTVRVRLNRPAFRKLAQRRRLRATVRATVKGRQAIKKVILVRR